jgi:photosystem II stability/assembly factor-like uncharacterized protein
MQDPSNREVVYAGTTEGLYKTQDGGRHFSPMTGADVIVNDVFVDPANPGHVLLATDRGGVLASDDGGLTFQPSNTGFSGRKVEALLVDSADPARLYAGVVNDKNFGGVFASSDGGATWQQIEAGLDGRDVFALAQSTPSQAGDGSSLPALLVAGTSRGIFVLQPAAADTPAQWLPRNVIANTRTKTAVETHAGKKVNVEKQVVEPAIQLESRVTALDVSSEVWLAATTYGLLTSHDQGVTWQGGPVMGAGEYLSVAVRGSQMAAARSTDVVISSDAGLTWKLMPIPTNLTRIRCVLFALDGTLWLGAREGVYFTHDLGKTWLWIERLPFRDIDDLGYDTASGRILATSRASDQIYAIDPKSLTWNWYRIGYNIARARTADGRLVVASAFDSVVVDSSSLPPRLAAK